MYDYKSVRENINLHLLTYFLFRNKRAQRSFTNMLNAVFGLEILTESNSSHIYNGYDAYASQLVKLREELNNYEKQAVKESNDYDLKNWVKEKDVRLLYRFLFPRNTPPGHIASQFLAIYRKAIDNPQSALPKAVDEVEFWAFLESLPELKVEKENIDFDIRLISSTQFDDIKNQFTRWKTYTETKDNRFSIPVNLVYNNRRIVSLQEEVLQNPDKSFFIYGKGGSGKTHLYIELFEKLISKDNPSVIPLYIPLNSVQPKKYNNSIIGELSERLREPISRRKLTEQEVDAILRNTNKNIILLADGLNEVTQEDERKVIAKELSEIASSGIYPNVHIMLSSRINHSTWFRSLGLTTYIQMKIEDLDEESIQDYLKGESCSVCYSDIDAKTKKLLRTAMGLSMYAKLVGKNYDTDSFTSLGGLLKAYMCLLLESKDYSIPNEDFLVSVAKTMMSNYSFTISLNELKATEGYCESKLRCVESVLTTQGSNKEGTVDEYTFSHQNFRDMLVAKSYSDEIIGIKDEPDKVSKIIQNNYLTANHELVSLVSDFLRGKNDILQYIIDHIPKNGTSFQLSKLIELYALCNDNSIATLTLSSHDLSNVRFSGYKLFDKNNSLTLEQCTVSTESFSMPGLTMASSVITSYTINNKTYLIAFCKTSFLIYDVEENTTTIHILENSINDINCCCKILYNNSPCILLGTDNGQLHLFHPDTRVLDTVIDFSNDKKKICSITKVEDSVFFTKKKNDNTYVVFSLSTNFKYKKIEDLCLSSSFCNDSKIDEVKKLCGPWRIQAKLATFSNSLFGVYGDKLYSYYDNCFHEIQVDIPDDEIEYRMFTDIALTESCIFINNVENVLVFYLDKRSKKHSVTYIGKLSIDEYKSESGNFFTSFSMTNHIDTILVGIGIRRAELRGDINFLEIKAQLISKLRKQYDLIPTPIKGKHTKTTYSGTYFNIDKNEDSKLHNYLATVSDDRSVQIIEVGNEDFEINQILGEYNGIRSIHTIDENTLICGGYDGCITRWENIGNEWHCTCTCKVHTSWIEKIRLFSYGNKTNLVISASLDGYIKITDMEQCLSRVIAVKNVPIKDICIFICQNKISVVFSTNESFNTILDYDIDSLLNEFYDLKSIKSLVDNTTIKVRPLDKGENGNAVILKSIDEPLCSYQSPSKESVVIKISNGEDNSHEILIKGFYTRCIDISNNYIVIAGNPNMKNIGEFHLYYLSDNIYKSFADYTFDNDAEIADVKLQESNHFITVHIIHKDKKLSVFCYNKSGTLENKSTIPFDSSEPVCLSIISNKHFIGTVGGEVLVVKSETTERIIQVRANLISNSETSIKEASEEFMNHFRGYFYFE